MRFCPSSNVDIRDDIILLDRGDYTSCTVNLCGATLTSWRINNKEMIFASRESHYTGLIRGGIQFIFPVIGEWEFGPHNGFARNSLWTVKEGPVRTENGDVYAVVSLPSNPYTESVWSHKFRLKYKIVLHEKKIVFHMGVENLSKYYPFTFKIMQQALMKVPDVTKCEIIGLKNCKYKNCLTGEIAVEDREKVTISKYTDRIYINADNEVIVTNTIKGGKLDFIKQSTHDITLWNPWSEKSKEIACLSADEYIGFIGVQAGLRSTTCLEPLSCWKARQTFEYIAPKENKKERKAPKDFYDLFEGYC
ncbi:hypothetical protein NQ315_007610 [Exocentrus adspersus]|uniref:glucose-6-phosphate 1-epimerase n=1 Tax=Exocentrus adspersus TaxID=1586481 RepID=A0AAV8W945_9CUCU|nr:hypothetical protein NQ315_007610 [Exocentrus adspersus]